MKLHIFRLVSVNELCLLPRGIMQVGPTGLARMVRGRMLPVTMRMFAVREKFAFMSTVVATLMIMSAVVTFVGYGYPWCEIVRMLPKDIPFDIAVKMIALRWMFTAMIVMMIVMMMVMVMLVFMLVMMKMRACRMVPIEVRMF